MTSRTRILFVHPGPKFNRVGGARMRWDALAEGMSRSAEVIRFETHCEADCADHPQGPAVEGPYGWMPGHDPCWIYYCPRESARLQAMAVECNPDIIAVSGLEMTRYLSEIPGTVRAQRVIDIKDVESQLRLDMANAVKDRPEYADYVSDEIARQWGELERAASRECDAVWTCTEPDRTELIKRYALDPQAVWVLPNAISQVAEAKPTKPQRVVLIGNLRYLPVALAAEYLIDVVTPALRKRRPGLDVLLAGRGPSEKLASKALSAGVQLVADPEDITPYWSEAVLIVPLSLGGGSKLKVLEAFSRFCPVVSSTKGLEGIDARDGEHYLLADNVTAYVDGVLHLLNNDIAREAMVRNANEFVLAHNGIGSVADAFTAFIAFMADRQRKPSS